MIADCLNQYACLAANINFNVDGLLKSFWQLTIDGLSWARSTRWSPSATPWCSACCG